MSLKIPFNYLISNNKIADLNNILYFLESKINKEKNIKKTINNHYKEVVISRNYDTQHLNSIIKSHTNYHCNNCCDFCYILNLLNLENL